MVEPSLWTFAGGSQLCHGFAEPGGSNNLQPRRYALSLKLEHEAATGHNLLHYSGDNRSHHSLASRKS